MPSDWTPTARPADLADEEILERLVALNHERAAEEDRGTIRWLRPDYQNPTGTRKAVQLEADLTDADDDDTDTTPAKADAKRPWPKTLPEQLKALRDLLADAGRPLSAAEAAQAFKGVRGLQEKITELLETLAAIGQARKIQGKYLG